MIDCGMNDLITNSLSMSFAFFTSYTSTNEFCLFRLNRKALSNLLNRNARIRQINLTESQSQDTGTQPLTINHSYQPIPQNKEICAIMKEEWFISINMLIESLNVTNTNNLEGVPHASRIILVSNSSRESSNWNRDLYSYECSCWTNGDQEYHPSTTAPRYKSYESTVYYLPHS